jgi:hypothetical protein
MEDSERKYQALKKAFAEVTLGMIEGFLVTKLSRQVYDNFECKIPKRYDVDGETVRAYVSRYCDLHEYHNLFMKGYVKAVLECRVLLRDPDYYWVFDRYVGETVWSQCFKEIEKMLPPEIYYKKDR